MNAKIIPPMPEAFALDRQVITGDLDVHIACPDDEIYGKSSFYYIVALRLVQDMAGKDVTDYEWEIIKDDLRTDFTFPLDNYDNGVYEILLQSYIKDGEEVICSEKNIYTTTLFRKKLYRKTVINDCGAPIFSAYDHIYGDESASMYVNNVLLNYPMQEEKGYLLEAEIWQSEDGLYHKASVQAVLNGEPLSEEYDAVFPTDENDIQLSGNKKALFFIPIERALEPSFILHLKEYSEPECVNIISEEDIELEAENFSAWFYLDFTRKTPEIMLTVAEEAADKVHVNIIAENFNPNTHCIHLSIAKKGAGEILSVQIEEAYHKIDLLTPGEYKVKAVLTNLTGKKAYDKEEVTVSVCSPAKLTFHHENTITCGDTLDMKIEAPLKGKIKNVSIGITGYDATARDIEMSDEISAKIDIPLDIPCGLHQIFSEVVLEDGQKVRGSSPVIVKKAGNIFAYQKTNRLKVE